MWRTRLPVRSAVLKPIIERDKFLKSLPPLKRRPYDFSVGAGDVGEDFITPHHYSERWLRVVMRGGDKGARVVKDTFTKTYTRPLIQLLLDRLRAL